MGVLGGVFGKTKGTIAIAFDGRANFYPGEVVTGIVTLTTTEEVEGDGLVMQLRGKESTVVKRGSGERSTTYRDSNVFISEKMVVMPIDGVLQPGQYSFRFQFPLPIDAPSSISYHCGCDSAYLSYFIIGAVDVKGTFSKDIRMKEPIAVYRMPPPMTSSLAGEKSGKVHLFCCIPRGEVDLVASIDKNYLTVGETLTVSAGVQNRSRSNINHVNAKLVRRVHYSASGMEEERDDVVCRTQSPGVGPGDSTNTTMEVSLDVEAMPTSEGKLMKCSYFVRVECDIPMAPDIEIDIPVSIYHLIPTEWTKVPEWLGVDFPDFPEKTAAFPCKSHFPYPQFPSGVPVVGPSALPPAVSRDPGAPSAPGIMSTAVYPNVAPVIS